MKLPMAIAVVFVLSCVGTVVFTNYIDMAKACVNDRCIAYQK